MTRIFSYNILVGGKRRIDNIERMIRGADPDVVGLVEATDIEVVKELAQRLDMDYRINLSPTSEWAPSLALLSRLPIISSTVHPNPGLRAKSLLEVCVQETHGERLTVFVTHLEASFPKMRGGDYIRRAELLKIIPLMRTCHGPHILIGDFNSLAPGDRLMGSNLLRYMVKLDQGKANDPLDYKKDPAKHKGSPSFNFVLGKRLRFLKPSLYVVARNKILSKIFDEVGSLYVARGAIAAIQAAGYVDCFRYVNPRAWGFTCPAYSPAGRIDFLFANPVLATRLSGCKVVTGWEDVDGPDASDHLPVMADFDMNVATTFPINLKNPIEAEEAVGDTF